MNNDTPKIIKTPKSPCPVCGSKNTRKDFDLPEMRVCEDCLSDFHKDGDITFNAKTFDIPTQTQGK
jgi:transcription initiation factor TFIIIB Brf1 subunit/transcription initiation factor TFIIB